MIRLQYVTLCSMVDRVMFMITQSIPLLMIVLLLSYHSGEYHNCIYFHIMRVCIGLGNISMSSNNISLLLQQHTIGIMTVLHYNALIKYVTGKWC